MRVRHVVCSRFFFNAVSYLIVSIGCHLFSHSTIARHLGCHQFGTVINRATVNILVPGFWLTRVLVPLGYRSRAVVKS